MAAPAPGRRTKNQDEKGRLKRVSLGTPDTLTAQDSDEHGAWKTAFLIMFLLSLLALALRFLFNKAFFTPEFEISLVYLPTTILLAVWVLEALKVRRLGG